MKRETVLTAIIVAMIAGIAIFAVGVPAAIAGNQTFGERLEELRDMSRPDRNAALRKMTPEERVGLWMQLKREDVAKRSTKSATSVADSSFPVTADQSAWGSASRAVGSITYDSGLASTAFQPGSPSLLGNRFDTHTGLPVEDPGTVSTVQALVVPGGGAITMQTSMGAQASAGFVMLGPQTGGGGAQAVFSTFTQASGLIDSVSFAGMNATYTGSSFLVLFGAFSSSYVPAFGTGTNNAQGHHGIIGNTGMMGPNITATTPFATPLNCFARASGNIVPVELMAFGVE